MIFHSETLVDASKEDRDPIGWVFAYQRRFA